MQAVEREREVPWPGPGRRSAEAGGHLVSLIDNVIFACKNVCCFGTTKDAIVIATYPEWC